MERPGTGRPGRFSRFERTRSSRERSGLSRANACRSRSKGELAVLLKKSNLAWGGDGTLARIPLEGGTPREMLQDVILADWAPNGEDLAVLVKHGPDAKTQLQYPIGTVLAQGDWFRSIRVSPNGDLVAFFGKGRDRRSDQDDRSKGQAPRHFRRMERDQVLAWSPGETRSSSRRRGEGITEQSIRAVSLSGRERVLVPNAQPLIFHDVAPDGRLLVENSAARGGILCQPRGETRERELGRLDRSTVAAISQDGRLVAFAEKGEAADSGVYLRKSDGSPAVRLGNATWISDISSDGQWVFCIDKGPPPQALLIPTGPGITKRVTLDGIPDRAGTPSERKGILRQLQGQGWKGDKLHRRVRRRQTQANPPGPSIPE